MPRVYIFIPSACMAVYVRVHREELCIQVELASDEVIDISHPTQEDIDRSRCRPPTQCIIPQIPMSISPTPKLAALNQLSTVSTHRISMFAGRGEDNSSNCLI